MDKKSKITAVLRSVKKITAAVLIAGLNWNGIAAVAQTGAFFFDSENSTQNIFAASTLDAQAQLISDFTPEIDEATAALAESMVLNTGGLDFYYRITATSTDELCGMINLTIEQGTYNHTQKLTEFDYSPGSFKDVGGNWQMSAGLADGAEMWEGKTCAFDLVFWGYQNADGSGFYDKEMVRLTLIAGGSGVLVWTSEEEFGAAINNGLTVFTDIANDGGDVKLKGEPAELSLTLRPDSDDPLQRQLLISTHPAGNTNHYARVNEETADDNTYVYVDKALTGQQLYDLYGIGDADAVGTINSVTVYSRCLKTGGSGSIYNILKTPNSFNSSIAYSPATTYEINPPTGDMSSTYIVNPDTNQPWTWSDINSLQIGVLMAKTDNSNHDIRCSQVWAEVDYETVIYEASGSLVSENRANASITRAWKELAWDALIPAETSIKISVAATNGECGAVTDWMIADQTISPVGLGGLPESKYICWKAVLESDEEHYYTPVLHSVLLSYDPGSAAGNIKINEFLPVPSMGSEWVELYNLSGRAVDLNGWIVETGAGEQPIVAANSAPVSAIITANGFLVVYLPDITLGDFADDVILRDSGRTIVDSYSYNLCDSDTVVPSPGNSNGVDVPEPATCVSIPADKSFARIPDGSGPWYDPVPTPGEPNVMEDPIAATEDLNDATTSIGIAYEIDGENETDNDGNSSSTADLLDSDNEPLPEPAEGHKNPQNGLGDDEPRNQGMDVQEALKETKADIEPLVSDQAMGETGAGGDADKGDAEPAAPAASFAEIKAILFAGVLPEEPNDPEPEKKEPAIVEPVIIPQNPETAE